MRADREGRGRQQPLIHEPPGAAIMLSDSHGSGRRRYRIPGAVKPWSDLRASTRRVTKFKRWTQEVRLRGRQSSPRHAAVAFRPRRTGRQEKGGNAKK
jgi:hypothetical protein